MSTCIYAFKTGKRKDQLCGKSADGLFCIRHRQQHVSSLLEDTTNNGTDSFPSFTITTGRTTPSANDTLDALYFRFMTLDLHKENKTVIENKFRYASTLNPSSTEYHKNVNWLKHALAFPYNKSIPVPVACEEESIEVSEHAVVPATITTPQKVATYISDVYERLDSYIYGMDRIKEEIMAFVCKRISNPSSSDHVLALQGKHGTGKCFAKGTEILMFDGQQKKVEEVRVGDVLMGDDGGPRTVLSLGTGFDKMYTVCHKDHGLSYTVNQHHILSLHTPHPRIHHLPDSRTYIVRYMTRDANVIQKPFHYSVQGGAEFSQQQAKHDAIVELMKGYFGVLDIPLQKLLQLPSKTQKLLKGFVIPADFESKSPLDERTAFGLGRSYLSTKRVELSDVLRSSRQFKIKFLRGLLKSVRKHTFLSTSRNIGISLSSSSAFLGLHELDLLVRIFRSVGLLVFSKSDGNLDLFGDLRTVFKSVEKFRRRTGGKYLSAFSSIEIHESVSDVYHGFTIDKNERFLLGNHIVTHNTRLARGLSKALNVPFRTINLGSVNDVSYFTGHGFTYVESEPGRIVQIMNETQCKNCIIYFDELDKIHQTEKGQAINGFLTHLIDPSQNKSFQDVYLAGLELDVSQVFFVFSFNDEQLIDKTVRDRLKIIHVSDPSLDDKIHIAERFIIPETCSNINLSVNFERQIIKRIVASQEGKHGLRGVKRIIEDIIAKLNVVRLMDKEGRTKLSYYRSRYIDMIEYIIQEDKNDIDTSVLAMYS